MSTAEHSIPVRLPNAAYEVLVRRGLVADIGSRLRRLNASNKAVIITDGNIPAHFIAQLRSSLESESFSPSVIVIPPGEEQKSIEHLIKIYDQVLPLKVDRSTPIIACGGGVVGDIAGFVAATVLRGVPIVHVPTSLLAMVDASIGGKTGVNHRDGKNLIGAFHQPLAVLIDPEVLRTLPPRELRGGLAECIKHDIIRDATAFEQLERNLHRALSLDLDYLTELIAHNAAIKAAIVAADPTERGEREHLNFGHTFGHAIEIVLKFKRSHGECVALGMTAAARLACDLQMIDETVRQRIVAVISAAQLPTHGLEADREAIVHAMSFDKKSRSGKLRFILPDRIGHVVVRDDVPIDRVRDTIDSLID